MINFPKRGGYVARPTRVHTVIALNTWAYIVAATISVGCGPLGGKINTSRLHAVSILERQTAIRGFSFNQLKCGQISAPPSGRHISNYLRQTFSVANLSQHQQSPSAPLDHSLKRMGLAKIIPSFDSSKLNWRFHPFTDIRAPQFSFLIHVFAKL